MEPVEPAYPFHVGFDASLGPEICRIVMVRGGAVRLQTDTRATTLLAGTLLLIPPRLEFRLVCGPGGVLEGFSFSGTLIDPLALNGAGEAVYAELNLAPTPRPPTPLSARLPAEEYRQACSLFEALAREADERKPGYQAMIRLRLSEAMLLLYRARQGARSPAAGAAPRFRLAEAERMLGERYADELTLGGIASHFGLNPSYFSRAFHREAGVTLVEYINRLRIRKSCLLLKRTKIGILEIAYAVGYRNISHFNRYFRRTMGMSPREYRALGGR